MLLGLSSIETPSLSPIDCLLATDLDIIYVLVSQLCSVDGPGCAALSAVSIQVGEPL